MTHKTIICQEETLTKWLKKTISPQGPVSVGDLEHIFRSSLSRWILSLCEGTVESVFKQNGEKYREL